MSEVSNEQPITPTNSGGQEAINRSNQEGLIVGDGTTDRVLIGFQKDGFGSGEDYGIKVSEDGVDVKTASDDELIMSSGFNMFKIIATGTVTLNASAAPGTYTTTVAHGQSFIPTCHAFINVPSFPAGSWLSGTYVEAGPVAGEQHLGSVSYVWSDSTNVNFRIALLNAAGQVGVYTFKYYIFDTTASS